MADLFTVTAPLLLRCPQDGERVVLRAWPHPRGMMCLGLYTADQGPARALFLVAGELKGAGPWKVGDCVVSVLGCRNTHPVPANDYAGWVQDIEMGLINVPDENHLRQCARERGALV